MPVKYELVDHKKGFHDKHWCVQILEGDYEGLIYQYDTVEFLEENNDTILKFNTITVENKDEYELTGDEFTSIIGDILVNIIEERLDEVEHGTSDTKESNT